MTVWWSRSTCEDTGKNSPCQFFFSLKDSKLRHNEPLWCLNTGGLTFRSSWRPYQLVHFSPLLHPPLSNSRAWCFIRSQSVPQNLIHYVKLCNELRGWLSPSQVWEGSLMKVFDRHMTVATDEPGSLISGCPITYGDIFYDWWLGPFIFMDCHFEVSHYPYKLYSTLAPLVPYIGLEKV